MFMTRTEVKAMLRRAKEKASMTTACLDLKPSYTTEIAATTYPSGYPIPKFQRSYSRQSNTREYVVCFIDSMGSFAHDADLCFREFSKSSTNRAYT